MDSNTAKKYLFLLESINSDAMNLAIGHLNDLGIRVLNRQGNSAIMAMARPDQVESAYKSGLFLAISARAIKDEHLKKLSEEQNTAVKLWNAMQSPAYHKLQLDRAQSGKSWASKEMDAEAPHTTYDPEEFKRALLKHLNIDEKELLAKYRTKKIVALKNDSFIKYERQLEEAYKNPTIAYHLSRMAFHLDPAYQGILLDLPMEFLKFFFAEPACWKMENEISVGVVFVESSKAGGPKFSASDRNTLQGRIIDGLDWLAEQAPLSSHLTWVYDWQFITIDVANGTNSSNEDYWRNPAMGKVSYQSASYSADWDAVADYREDMRQQNNSSHAIVIFVTPYANSWHAYAGGSRITLANRNNWGGWGINTVNMITAHEACHLFGAADEYTGSGTPCSTCTSTHGCDNIPNGNCAACASPHQACVMDANSDRLCAYTRGQIGWADLFAELTTGDVQWAGTDDDVWLDTGDRTYYLDTPNHDDRERNNREAYALSSPGITKSQIKRIGIRKSSDGFSGGWNLRRVRLWLKGELICDQNNINQWLEDEYLWWASTTCGSSSSIVNRLQIRITTADVSWAGTDDDVSIYLGGRHWHLDNPGHDDFERGHTDTFDLDPGTGLYRSMIHSIRIHKSPDGVAGGWKLKGLQILVNGVSIYNNQGINKWLENNDRDWYGTV